MMIGKRSRYASSVLYVDGDNEFLGTRKSIDSTPRSDDRFHTVEEGDRVDLLAYRYLGDASLWWVICDFNEINFPLELAPGRVIRIPSVEYVAMEVF